MCLSEGIGHTAAEDEFVHFAKEVLNDTDLGAHFRTTHDRYERTFDIFKYRIYCGYLFLHKETKHFVVCIKIVCDDSGRCMFAVCGTESVHDIAVCVGSKSLGELFLACFHLFLCGFVSRIFFLDAYRFAFLFGIETEVLEHEYLARLEGCSLILCFRAILSELNGTTERCGNSIFNLAEAELSRYLAFGFAHMAHNDKCTSFVENVLEGRQRTADTGVVCDLAIFIQRYVEIYTYDRFFTSEFVIFDNHNVNILKLLVLFPINGVEPSFASIAIDILLFLSSEKVNIIIVFDGGLILPFAEDLRQPVF